MKGLGMLLLGGAIAGLAYVAIKDRKKADGELPPPPPSTPPPRREPTPRDPLGDLDTSPGQPTAQGPSSTPPADFSQVPPMLQDLILDAQQSDAPGTLEMAAKFLEDSNLAPDTVKWLRDTAAEMRGTETAVRVGGRYPPPPPEPAALDTWTRLAAHWNS